MKKKQEENYLERCPVHREGIEWSSADDGLVTLHIENKGVMNRILQKLIKKPKVSHIHLDELGSFIWPLIDGKRRIMDMGSSLEEHFGEKAQPTYERLAKFFRILEECRFIEWK